LPWLGLFQINLKKIDVALCGDHGRINDDDGDDVEHPSLKNQIFC
jgi:hypothetical protein